MIWLTEPSELHRNSPQGLNISSIRVFDQSRDPEIPINLRPHNGSTELKCYMLYLQGLQYTVQKSLKLWQLIRKFKISKLLSPREGMGGSLGDVSEEPVTYKELQKGWRMSCDVGEVTESLENQNEL